MKKKKKECDPACCLSTALHSLINRGFDEKTNECTHIGEYQPWLDVMPDEFVGVSQCVGVYRCVCVCVIMCLPHLGCLCVCVFIARRHHLIPENNLFHLAEHYIDLCVCVGVRLLWAYLCVCRCAVHVHPFVVTHTHV